MPAAINEMPTLAPRFEYDDASIGCDDAGDNYTPFQLVENKTYYFCFEFAALAVEFMEAMDVAVFKSRQDEENEPMEGVFKDLGIE
jgi:hypothetical protein